VVTFIFEAGFVAGLFIIQYVTFKEQKENSSLVGILIFLLMERKPAENLKVAF